MNNAIIKSMLKDILKEIKELRREIAQAKTDNLPIYSLTPEETPQLTAMQARMARVRAAKGKNKGEAGRG
jgi:hypothetical protein